MIQMLYCLKLSQRFLGLSSFFLNSYFFILFRLDVYFFLLFQIVDLSPGFLPFTVGSLFILLYFTLGSLYSSIILQPSSISSVSILIISVLNSASDRLSISLLLSSFSGVLICSCVWALFLCFGTTAMLNALGIHQGRATLFAVLWCCLWGSGQRGNNAAGLLRSSHTFLRTLLWTWEFLLWTWEFLLPLQPPQPFTARSFESLVSYSSSATLPMQSAALLHILSTQLLVSCLSPLLLVWMNVSLAPWLLEFHAVLFSGTSGCSLF